ncbi:MAG: class I SAM-dependent methyltransferase [Bacteroidales bacterium]|nr:class I SAM-dependent methyltransferase [Bacteroidales bacterium]
MHKTLEESVVAAMDGTNSEIFKYLPYILQDFWEIGASPSDMIRLIKKYKENYPGLKILDLGCGKGAVSIRIAHELGCECWGYDGISEFIEEAKQKASEYNVSSLCHFETADIREKIHEFPPADIIILGAIGQVFGNYYETLMKLSKCLKEDGLILIDDAYREDSAEFYHPAILKRSELLDQIARAEMQLVDELIPEEPEAINEEHDQEFDSIIVRCNELMEKYPEKRVLFEDYIKQQNTEYEVLEGAFVVCLTMVIKKRKANLFHG